MARLVRISSRAIKDIGLILEWTELRFGEAVRDRYSAVMYRAIDQLRHEAEIDSASPVEGLPEDVFVYHVGRARVGTSGKIDVRRPRHYLVCRWRPMNQVEVITVLHDSADLKNQLDEGLGPEDS